MLQWFGDTLMRDGEDIVVDGCRTSVQEDFAHIGGETIAVRGWFAGKMVFYREGTTKPAARRALAAARRAVEQAANDHFAQQEKA